VVATRWYSRPMLGEMHISRPRGSATWSARAPCCILFHGGHAWLSPNPVRSRARGGRADGKRRAAVVTPKGGPAELLPLFAARRCAMAPKAPAQSSVSPYFSGSTQFPIRCRYRREDVRGPNLVPTVLSFLVCCQVSCPYEQK